MKLHRKIKHNEKVCRAQYLGSYEEGQGHSLFQRSNLCLSHNNSETTEANFSTPTEPNSVNLQRRVTITRGVLFAKCLVPIFKIKVLAMVLS